MWEALALEMPWNEKKYAFTSRILDAVESGKRPEIVPSVRATSPAGFVEIMERCWSQDPHNRPAFQRIFLALEDVMVSIFKDSEADQRRGSLLPTSASRLETDLTTLRRRHNAKSALHVLKGKIRDAHKPLISDPSEAQNKSHRAASL